MRYSFIKSSLLFLVLLAGHITMKADYPINYEASFITNAGGGNFAPYYTASNIHGILTQPYSALVRGLAYRPLSTSTRFSYGFGIDLIGGWTSKTRYSFYDTGKEEFNTHKEGPSWGWIQQLYAEIKFRGVFLTAGMKESNSALLNQQLSSGDLISSGNSRPMSGARIGFIDFQNIPFTRGWVQIQGEFGFAKQTDSSWLENHYNYYNYFITTNSWYNYKRVYFRTKPSERFSITIGMQAAAQFGGTYRSYKKGILDREETFKVGFWDFMKVIIPLPGANNSMLSGDNYYSGNHLGSWDFVAQYRLKNNDIIKAYFQFPWEDGSGIGKLNGWDGLWGIEYQNHRKWYINGAVIEYIDFTNQSGPMHWAPGDHKDTTIHNPATGGDDYYNNYMYNGYQYYGMSIGTPFAKSPLYNLDGYMRYTDNRIRGFHFGINGNILPDLKYRLLVSYRNSLGTPLVPQLEKQYDTSFMLEGIYDIAKIKGLSVKGQFAFDRGNMYGNNTGAMVSLSYKGLLNF